MKKQIIMFILLISIFLIMFLFYSNKNKTDMNKLNNIDINILLNEPEISYNKYRNKYIKVTGKISKIIGFNKITLQAYIKDDEEINGHVTFNETSKLIIELNDVDISKYKIYDYITVIGKLSNFNKQNQELILINYKIEENNLYGKYKIELLESKNCEEEIILYSQNLYTYCLDNIYLDYYVDKYELNYVLKDKKITLEELFQKGNLTLENNYKVHKFEKISIISCNHEKNIIFSNNKKIDYSFCKE